MTGWTSPTHIVLLLLIALLLFGAKRLPEIGRSLGHGMREFKDSLTGDHHDRERPELSPPVTTDAESFSPEERERLRALLDADKHETRT
jgi:sec-independent protein translocase protein TatA